MVLCALLFVVCFLAVRHRRKRNNKIVMPGRPKEEKNKGEEDGRSNRNESAGNSENRDPELAGTRRPLTGVRAKSANAILFMSPFCVTEKDQVTVSNKTRAQSKDTENQADEKQKVENETEATGGIQRENITNITGVTERDEKGAGENPHCVSVSTDTVPYLSIGTSQSKTTPGDLNEQPTDSLGQRSQMGRVMGRISTWPPTAIQWQARCRMKEEEEGNEAEKSPAEVKKTPKKVEHPSVSDQDRKEGEIEKNQMEDLPTAPIQDLLNMRPAQSSNLNGKTTSLSEAHGVADIKQEDPATARRQTITTTQSLNQGKLNQDLRPAENPAHESSSSKAETRHEPKRTESSRQRADNRSTGSKAPSGGASPDDETLLQGNRYAFMDLLHEVVQNNGRWTRERWKQTHVNKQRR